MVARASVGRLGRLKNNSYAQSGGNEFNILTSILGHPAESALSKCDIKEGGRRRTRAEETFQSNWNGVASWCGIMRGRCRRYETQAPPKGSLGLG